VRVVGTLTRATGSDGLVGGETTDILMEGQAVDEATVEFIHAKKTGSLIAASCAIGAILGGAHNEQIISLEQYGRHIGLAFQIADDLLNETATSEQLGKSAGSDRERGKATYPALFGIERSRQIALTAAEEGMRSLGDLDSPFLREIGRFSVERLS
jgi:geranylgeranyl diphosphate synthase type II